MLKRTALYSAIAVFLGVVTMVAPLMLLKPRYYELVIASGGKTLTAQPSRELLDALDEGQEMYGEGGILERAVSSANLLSAGLIVIPALLLSLGVFLYVNKRMQRSTAEASSSDASGR